MELKITTNNTKQKAYEPAVSPLRKILFYLILALIPVFLFVLLETSLRLFGFGTNLDLFVRSEKYPGYYEINQNVSKRYFFKEDKTSPSNDIFLVEKPDNCYRIFVMGGSTTRGFPYTMGVTFSRILNYRLQDAFPDRRIEVVNTSMTAVNSITLSDIIDEILAMKPDAILIYAGHNEYYGALGVASVEKIGNADWIKHLHLSLVKLRTYQLIQKLVGRIKQLFTPYNVKPTSTMMEAMVGDKEIPYKSQLYQSGIEQFRKNMDRVIRKSKEAEVPVIFSEVVSNIGGNPPFSSVEVEGYPTAAEAFERACTFEAEDMYDEARRFYYLAKDLDGLRFRATEDLNNVIHEIAGKYSVPVLGMKEVFEKASPNRIVGNSLMTEHLHPNVDGYFLMADAFFCEMQKDRFIADQWDSLTIKPPEFYRKNWGFTQLDSLVADLTIRALTSGWPFKPDSVINDFIYTYKPVSMVDSIAAMCVLYDNINISTKHRDLAKIYLDNGDKRAAFNEYYSLIKDTPYNTYLYVEALKILMELQDYQTALNLMLSMPDRKDSFMAEFQIGEIYQQLGEHKLALESFEKARKIPGNEDKVEALLISEYHSSIALNESALSAKILNEIRKTNPGFQLEDTKKNVVTVYIPKEVKDLIEEAMKQAQLQNLNEALALLEKSLKIKETPFAFKLMGSIYYQLEDPRALSYLERAHAMDSKDLSTIRNLFVLYLLNKDFTNASAMLEKFKSLSHDTEQVDMLSRTLDEARKKVE